MFTRNTQERLFHILGRRFPSYQDIAALVYGGSTLAVERWLDSLRDRNARTRIKARLKRLNLGNFGDSKSVGSGVYELRIDYDPGYRIYYVQIGATVLLLLCGGDKNTQEQDIRRAKEYWEDYEKRENADE